MTPPNQSFDADESVGIQVDLWLIHQEKLVVVKGCRKVARQIDSRDGLLG
jgi:hypothetical protein